MALKLSDADKKTIVELYQHPEESTATLASRYAVSSSTISRILKQELSPEEYQSIVQQKKGGGSKPQSPKALPQQAEPVALASSKPKAKSSSSPARPKLKSAVVPEEDLEGSQSVSRKPTSPKTSKRSRTRQRSSAKAKTVLESQEVEHSAEDAKDATVDIQLQIDSIVAGDSETVVAEMLESSVDDELVISVDELDASPDDLVHEIQSDLLDVEDFDDDEDLDDELDDDEDLDDELDEDLDDELDATLELPLAGDQLSILPFSEAKLPRTCYIIIDRSAELVTRPLKNFADLGTVPDEEINEPTLPIFDNHRVAKRFANRRTQRIVKVPDAKVLHKTSLYLMDKGITRLLLDGQVYALLDEDEFEPVD